MGLFDRLKKGKNEEPYKLSAPVSGEAINIKEVRDKVFSSESMGKGVGILAEKGKDYVCAPISGVISALFPTLHAIGITTDNGVEILLHIGIDTVNLNGKGFTTYVKQGQRVKRGDRLLLVEFEMLKKEGYDMTIMIIVTNTEEYKTIVCKTGKCTMQTEVIEVLV